jgi:23S rRNA-intervening sequence protein
VGANIGEGYGRRRYKADYIRLLIYSISSNDETIFHLEGLYETGSLTDKLLYDHLLDQALHLGSMLNLFIQSIEEGIRTPWDAVSAEYRAPSTEYLAPGTEYLAPST